MPPKSLQMLPDVRPTLHSNRNKIRVILCVIRATGCKNRQFASWQAFIISRVPLICKFQEIGEEGYAGGVCLIILCSLGIFSVSDCGRRNTFLIMWSSNTQEYLMFFVFNSPSTLI